VDAEGTLGYLLAPGEIAVAPPPATAAITVAGHDAEEFPLEFSEPPAGAVVRPFILHDLPNDGRFVFRMIDDTFVSNMLVDYDGAEPVYHAVDVVSFPCRRPHRARRPFGRHDEYDRRHGLATFPYDIYVINLDAAGIISGQVDPFGGSKPFDRVEILDEAGDSISAGTGPVYVDDDGDQALGEASWTPARRISFSTSRRDRIN